MPTSTLARIVSGMVAVFTLTAAVLGWLGLDITRAGLLVTPELAQVSEPSAEVIDAAQGAIGELRTVLADVATVTDQVGASSGELVTVLDGVSTLTTEDIPETLAAVENSLPALLDTASVIDGAMRTLSFVGVDYNPEQPFDESIAEIQVALDGLPEQIAEQGAVLESTLPDIADSAERMQGVGDQIRAMDGNLADAEAALGGYDTALGGLETFAQIADDIDGLLPVARFAVILFALSGLGLAWAVWEFASRLDARVDRVT